MKTKLFLDGGDPEETRQVLDLLGFLDGQTTNPTLISKNPEAAKRLQSGEKFTKEEILNFYKSVVSKLSLLLPDGSISIEVIADKNTTASEMLAQGKDMFEWIPNAHIKYPTNSAGLEAAEESIRLGMRVNMTLVFSQEQAAAVYAATKGAVKGQVFVSPFIGRLDDKGENGMDLIENILKMYKDGDGHVEVLTASVRGMDHFLEALNLGSDIITGPVKILKEWADNGQKMPDENFVYDKKNLKEIPYQDLDLSKNWKEFNIKHDLTDIGIEKFTTDWNGLIK